MKETIDLVTDGRIELTPKAAVILADMIRRAFADQQHCNELPATEHLVERLS